MEAPERTNAEGASYERREAKGKLARRIVWGRKRPSIVSGDTINAAGRKKWWEWVRDIDLRHIGQMARILARAQKLMDPQAYLAEFSVPTDSP